MTDLVILINGQVTRKTPEMVSFSQLTLLPYGRTLSVYRFIVHQPLYTEGLQGCWSSNSKHFGHHPTVIIPRSWGRCSNAILSWKILKHFLYHIRWDDFYRNTIDNKLRNPVLEPSFL
ncbi:hypothetical protein TNCV_2527171 [Trichonephila clavipes]|nr:hypothetical protein TNCV_2527171 [Trichonephila clavipes]